MVHSRRGARQALYIHEPGSFVPLATVQGAGEEHSDLLGALLELTEEQGQVAWAADYKVCGEGRHPGSAGLDLERRPPAHRIEHHAPRLRPLGRRVARSDAFGSTHYLWDGDLMVHSQRGARQALYIYEPGSFVPLATVQGAGEERSTYAARSCS